MKLFFALVALAAAETGSTDAPWTQFTSCDEAQGFIEKLFEGPENVNYTDIYEIRRECAELCISEDRGDCWDVGFFDEFLQNFNCSETREGILEFQAGQHQEEV